MKFRYLLWLLLIVPAIALTACGGGDDDDGDTDAPAESGASADTGDGAETPDAANPTDEEDETDEPADDGDAQGGTGLACELVTAEEAAEAVGGEVEAPEYSPSIGSGFDQCLYRIVGGTELDPAAVIQSQTGVSEDEFEELVAENAPEELGALEPIPDLGDKAYQQAATFVLAGDTMIVVTVINNDPDFGEAAGQDLARTAVERAP